MSAGSGAPARHLEAPGPVLARPVDVEQPVDDQAAGPGDDRHRHVLVAGHQARQADVLDHQGLARDGVARELDRRAQVGLGAEGHVDHGGVREGVEEGQGLDGVGRRAAVGEVPAWAPPGSCRATTSAPFGPSTRCSTETAPPGSSTRAAAYSASISSARRRSTLSAAGTVRSTVTGSWAWLGLGRGGGRRRGRGGRGRRRWRRSVSVAGHRGRCPSPGRPGAGCSGRS